jgi:predicted membrane protein
MGKAVSLVLAFGFTAALLLLPAMRGGELTPAEHGLLTVSLLALCALFVHGVGYRPDRAWAARLLSPWVLWPFAAVLCVAWWRIG